MMRTRTYYWLSLAMALAVPAYVLVNPLMKSLGMERGLTGAQALAGVTIASVANIIGRVVAPTLSDKIGRKAVVYLLFLMAMLSSLGLIVAGGAVFVVLCAFICMVYGGVMSVFPVLRILEEYYHMEEEDFVSAELEIVPDGSARDCGIDRSMILAYGQDDRVCAFTSLFAMLDTEAPERTACCILVDKEEIGSVGATGMHSRFFENVIAELVALEGQESELKVRRTLQNSRMLSSDVSAA